MRTAAGTDREFMHAVLEACEGEISGAVFFDALAAQYNDPAISAKLRQLAHLERWTEAQLLPLILRLDLQLRDRATLATEGAAQAAQWQGLSWETQLRRMCDEFTPYAAKYRELAQHTPAEYTLPVARLAAHEVALIEFSHRELAGRADSLKPVQMLIAGQVA